MLDWRGKGLTDDDCEALVEAVAWDKVEELWLHNKSQEPLSGSKMTGMSAWEWLDSSTAAL